MIEVTRKDGKESAENLVRRFNRRVQQSGLVIAVKSGQYFEKPLSKRDRRKKAIIRNERKALKLKKKKMPLIEISQRNKKMAIISRNGLGKCIASHAKHPNTSK
jgi:ribosomal protein S21